MILVIGGTSEGRAIARELVSRGAEVLATAATGYGGALLAEDGVAAAVGRLNSAQLAELLVSKSVKVLVDASHPFATEVSRNAAGACEMAGVPYIRYARPEEMEAPGPAVQTAGNYRDAARMACGAGRTIFLATGSKTAGIFVEEARKTGSRVVVRAMPDPEIIRSLLTLGISPGDVVAARGPFGEDMNMALLKHFRADVLVTKESGRAGGIGEKISAAAKLGLPVIMIKRPPEPPGAVGTVEEAVKLAMEHYL